MVHQGEQEEEAFRDSFLSLEGHSAGWLLHPSAGDMDMRRKQTGTIAIVHLEGKNCSRLGPVNNYILVLSSCYNKSTMDLWKSPRSRNCPHELITPKTMPKYHCIRL